MDPSTFPARNDLVRAQTHERNESALRRAQRKLISARNEKAFFSAIDVANETGRAARCDALAGALYPQRSTNGQHTDNGGYKEECTSKNGGADGDAFIKEPVVVFANASCHGCRGGEVAAAELFSKVIGRDNRVPKEVAHREKRRGDDPLRQRGSQPETGEASVDKPNYGARRQERGGLEERRYVAAESSGTHPPSSTRIGLDEGRKDYLAEVKTNLTHERRGRSDKEPRIAPPPRPTSMTPLACDDGDALHVEGARNNLEVELGLPRPLTAASLGRNKGGGSFSSSSEHSPDQAVLSPINSRGETRERGRESEAPVGMARVSRASWEQHEDVTAVAVGGVSRSSGPQASGEGHRQASLNADREGGGESVHSKVRFTEETATDCEKSDDRGGGGNSHGASGWIPWAEKGPEDQTAGLAPYRSLATTAKAVAALTLQIESVATIAFGAARDAGTSSSSSVPSLVLDGYSSIDAVSHADKQAAITEATTTKDSSPEMNNDDNNLGAFGLRTLCGAVLELITSKASDILPVESLSGIVTATKVRAQHRRQSPPGTVQLFDAVARHARWLAASEDVSLAAIARTFAPCFEEVIAGASALPAAAERLRRKLCALLESAADPDSPTAAKSDRISMPLAVASAGLMPAAAHGGNGGGGGGNGGGGGGGGGDRDGGGVCVGGGGGGGDGDNSGSGGGIEDKITRETFYAEDASYDRQRPRSSYDAGRHATTASEIPGVRKNSGQELQIDGKSHRSGSGSRSRSRSRATPRTHEGNHSDDNNSCRSSSSSNGINATARERTRPAKSEIRRNSSPNRRPIGSHNPSPRRSGRKSPSGSPADADGQPTPTKEAAPTYPHGNSGRGEPPRPDKASHASRTVLDAAAGVATNAGVRIDRLGSGATAGSGSVVLGGGGRKGRRAKGNLNLSAMGLGSAFTSGEGGSLPEFEVGGKL